MDEKTIKEIVADVINEYVGVTGKDSIEIPVEISGRHVHLSSKHLEALFGKDYILTKQKDISQPGQYLCKERVTLIGPKGQLSNVAVLGPVRDRTQVEITMTEGVTLGLRPPVRMSGDLNGAGTIFIMAGSNMVTADESLIVALNHIHITPQEASDFGVTDGQRVRVLVRGARAVTFENVPVRVSSKASFAMHIDYDEANACGMEACGTGLFLKLSSLSGVEAAAPAKPSLSQFGSSPKLVSEEYAKKLVAENTGKIQLSKKSVITPLARDVFSQSKRKVEFV